MEFSNALEQARQEKTYQALLDKIPYAKKIGVVCFPLGNDLIYKLPVKQQNQGNPFLPALHGGVIGGFMEMAATLEVIFRSETQKVPKVVDFSIDYLRPGRMQDSYAECTVVRQGRKIVNVMINAWQTTQREPIATARAHFLLK